jgi:hypothetical protein
MGAYPDYTINMNAIVHVQSAMAGLRAKNRDLWWAPSGGGPGNYGVVWFMTTKIYPDVLVSTNILVVPQGVSSDEML